MTTVLKIADKNFDAAVAKGNADGCSSFDKGTEVFVVEVPNAVLACVRPKGRQVVACGQRRPASSRLTEKIAKPGGFDYLVPLCRAMIQPLRTQFGGVDVRLG